MGNKSKVLRLRNRGNPEMNVCLNLILGYLVMFIQIGKVLILKLHILLPYNNYDLTSKH
jgi:hypothetical protein